VSRPRGWDRVGVPVVTGPRPEGSITLAALAGRQGFTAAMSHVGEAGTRERAMTVLHHALMAVSGALIAPMAVDGLALTVSPGELGVVPSGSGAVSAIWVGHHSRPELLLPAAHLGTQAMRLVGGVADRVRHVSGLPSRGVAEVIAQVLERDCRRFTGTAHGTPSPGWYDEFRTAAGLPRVRWRRLVLRPDAGPDVVLEAPATCCVLSRAAGDASCPGCPRHRREDQAAIFAEWLAGLAEPDFYEVTGRARMTPVVRAA